MQPAILLLEFDSIAIGIRAGDAMAKVNPAPEGWNQPSQWALHCKSQCGQDGQYERDEQKADDEPARPVFQRNVFAIGLGSIVLATMVIEMDVVEKGRKKEWDATQRVPCEAKTVEAIPRQMH